VNLFRAILAGRSGVIFSEHLYDEVWSLVKTPDRKIHLAIPEMLEQWSQLAQQPVRALVPGELILAAGERRSYNANQIFRDPAWRKVDPQGAMRMHPDDALARGLAEGDRAVCCSKRDEIPVVIEIDEAMRPGMVSMPHGYGTRYQGGEPRGPELNRLTSLDECEPFSRTPYHKHVVVRVSKAQLTEA
jgi:anaerobic selenocysteine-containing dehydrogenase